MFRLLLLATLLSGCSAHWVHPTHELNQVMMDIRQCEREAYASSQKKDLFEIVDFSRYHFLALDEDDEVFIEQREYVEECMESLGYYRE